MPKEPYLYRLGERIRGMLGQETVTTSTIYCAGRYTIRFIQHGIVYEINVTKEGKSEVISGT